jgi:hypothetical protein
MSVYKEPIEWIRQSIDSILAQTFGGFEFLIVNDNPSRIENTELLKEYHQKDARVVAIINETNIGLTKSLNKALAVAQGEYIARMDADDMSLSQRFEKQVAYLDAHPEICGVGSWTGNIDEQGNKIPGVAKYDTDPRWIRAQFLQNSQVGHPAAMFRRVMKGHVARYDESVRYAQDYSLWVSLLPYGDISNIPEVLFCYRHSEQQITSSKKAEQQECAGVAQRKAFALFDFPVTDSFIKQFFAMTIQHNMDLPLEEVRKEFCGFFKKIKLTDENSLALEIIYSSYLAYLQHWSCGAKFKFMASVLKNSSPFMLMLGCRLGLHLYQRKAKRQ